MKGPEGNIEYLLYLKKGVQVENPPQGLPEGFELKIQRIVRNAHEALD